MITPKNSTFRSLCRLGFLTCWLLLAGTFLADAQIVVYKLAFKKEGRSLNFSFYQGGYFVATAPQGIGTFILLVEENGRRYYTTSSEGGELFISDDGDLRMVSIAGTGGGSGSQSLLLASGFDPKSQSLGGGISIPVVEDLKGVFSAYGSLSTNVDGTDESASSSSIGDSFAGSAEVKAKLDIDLSREANSELANLARATEIVIQAVRRQGYLEEPGGDGGGEGVGEGEEASVITGSVTELN